MLYLTKGGFWLSIGSFVSGATSFILSLAFANLLPQTAYGVYKYVLSVASTINAFTLTGLETAVIEAVARGKEGVLRQAFWKNLKWSIPASLAATFAGLYYFLNGNSTLSISLFLIALVQPLTTSAALAAAFLNGKKAFQISAGYYAVNNILPAGVLLGVMSVSSSALHVILAYFGANLVSAVGLYWYVNSRFAPTQEEDHSAMTYGKHLSLMNVISNVADNLDKILAFQLLGAAPLAIYSFALALPSQSKLLTKSLSSLMFPKFAERPAEELRQGMGQKTLRFFLLGLAMAIGYILIAPYVFRLIYPQYTEAVLLSQIYATSFLAITAAPMGLYLSAKRRVRAQYFINAFMSVFQVLAVLIGIATAGLLGLMLSRIATRFMGAFLAAYFYLTDKPEPGESLQTGSSAVK
ncbi:oligosaccharide flippase family protein [Candidatus Parcubacteria bacterium]|nr:oligosaccharide flippase family protein [Candidatus Parcubacteria bacterium]